MALIDEIALEAGVTKMTVLNVLNGKNKENRPSARLRAERIRAIAKRLNYQPSAAARAIRTGRFHAIGLLLSEDDPSKGSMFPDAWRAIAHQAGAYDLHLTVGHLLDALLTSEDYMPKILREWATDGLLINYIADIPPRMRELIQKHRVPSIWMNTQLDADCVYPDDLDAARQATRYLIGKGHRRILYFDTVTRHYSGADRRQGYLDAMAEAGLEAQVVGSERAISILDLFGYCQQYLPEMPRPGAILAYEAYVAIPVYCAALRLGLRVPEDLSFVCFHDRPVDVIGEVMTTSVIPAENMGRIAVEMLLEKIACPEQSLAARPLPHRLVEGHTARSV